MRYLKLSFGSNNGKRTAQTRHSSATYDRPQTDLHSARRERSENYKVADCCCPIPGDDVLGYVEDDETVVVHKGMSVAMRLKSSFGPRLVSTQWEASESLSFPAKIEIQGIDRIGFSTKSPG